MNHSRLEIDAAPVFLPISEARRIRPVPAACFFFRFVLITLAHRCSWSDSTSVIKVV